jgi:hypothetical protein
MGVFVLSIRQRHQIYSAADFHSRSAVVVKAVMKKRFGRSYGDGSDAEIKKPRMIAVGVGIGFCGMKFDFVSHGKCSYLQSKRSLKYACRFPRKVIVRRGCSRGVAWCQADFT